MAQDNPRTGLDLLLRDKIVVVTGASSGIGKAIALACATAGANIATTYRANREGADKVAAEIKALGRECIVLQVDVTDAEDLAGAGQRGAGAFRQGGCLDQQRRRGHSDRPGRGPGSL